MCRFNVHRAIENWMRNRLHWAAADVIIVDLYASNIRMGVRKDRDKRNEKNESKRINTFDCLHLNSNRFFFQWILTVSSIFEFLFSPRMATNSTKSQTRRPSKFTIACKLDAHIHSPCTKAVEMCLVLPIFSWFGASLLRIHRRDGGGYHSISYFLFLTTMQLERWCLRRIEKNKAKKKRRKKKQNK